MKKDKKKAKQIKLKVTRKKEIIKNKKVNEIDNPKLIEEK